jgi:large subunit ribosomal protein L35
MPKMKTHKGAKKRFKITASGKVMRTQAGHQKYSIKKKGTKLQKMRKVVGVHPSDAPRIKRMLQS